MNFFLFSFQDLGIPTPATLEDDVSSIIGLERREEDMEITERYLFIYLFARAGKQCINNYITLVRLSTCAVMFTNRSIIILLKFESFIRTRAMQLPP